MFTRAFRHIRTTRLRRLAPVGVSLALIAAPMMLLPSPAEAAPATTLTGSPFNGSNGVLDQHAAIGEHPDVGTPDTFGGGVKEDTDCPPMGGGGAPDKADIDTGWVGSANGVVGGANHTFLYLAWSRPADHGTATVDFELNSGSVSCGSGSSFVKRVAGVDLLFEYDFQGGSTIGVSARTWTSTNQGGAWSAPVTIATNVAEASISNDRLFGELVVDMTAAGFFTPNACKVFTRASLKTRASSSSFQNQLKDLILPFPVDVTNCGSLTVTKTVVGGTVGDSFGFTVDCGAVDLNGDADGTDLHFALADGESRTIDDLFLGTTCSVSETDPGASDWTTSYTVTGLSGSQSGLVAAGIAIALGDKMVAFTNTRLRGDLVITKAADAPGSFFFDVDCSDDGFDALNVSVVPGTPYRVSGIPTGTTCTVTEHDNEFFSSVVVPDGGQVEIVVGDNVVAFTNTRLTGDLVITKASDVPGSFGFTIDCSDDAFDDAVLIAGGASHRVPGIPTGTTCTVTEDANEFFSSVVTPESGTTVIGLGDNTVAFTNTRLRGDLVITKAADAPGSFFFDVDCSDDGFDALNVSVVPGTPYRVSGIPTGTTCTVTEHDNEFFSSVVVPDGGQVEIVVGDNVVAFTNTRLTGDLVITKASDVPGSFGFTIDCSDDAFDDAVLIAGGASHRVPGIPTGTTCTVTEDANDLFTSVVVPSDGTRVIGLGDNTVAFTNTRLRGTLVVTKVADQPGTFVFDVDCTDDSYDRSGIQIVPGKPYVLEGIPTTTRCTVTERDNPLFDTRVVPDHGSVVIDLGLHTVAFTNTAKPNGISIDKTVNGEDTSAGNPLVVAVGSTLDYEVVITNRGQVPLTVSELTDSLKANLGESCQPAADTQLDPGASITCSYTMTATDPGGASIIHNTATVTGVDVFERTAGPEADETFVHVLGSVIELDKAGPAQAHVGDTVTYTLTVTNPGNTPLLITGWEDPVCSAEPVLTTRQGEDEWLDPGEVWVYQCSHVVVAGDPDPLVNTATVTAVDRLEREVDDTDDAVTEILRPAIAITKTGSTSAHVGDPVVYTLVVTNPGNTPLASVTVADPKCDAPPVRSTLDADELLSPGEAWTYECTHIVTVADGTSILNTARAEGTDPLGETVDSTADHTATVLRPAISIVKTASPESISVSGTVTYTYVVTNTGDTALFDVEVSDDILGPIGRVERLEPGESVTLTSTVDVDASSPPRNVGTVVGTDALGLTVSATDDAVITVVLGAVVAQMELPRTGAPLRAQAWAGLALIQVGLVLTLAGRRRWAVRRAV